MNIKEINLSNDLNVITAEINSYKQVAGQAIFEIGRRLLDVKFNPSKYNLPSGRDKEGREVVARGYWGEWLKSVDIEPTKAKQFMKVYSELGSKSDMCHLNTAFRSLYEIAQLPKEQRNQSHTIPSTGEQKTVDEMTVRELREVKKALKEKEQQLNQLEQDKNKLGQLLTEERNKPQKVKEVVKEKIIDKTDYQTINRLKRDIEGKENKLADLEKHKKLLEDRLKQEEKDASEYNKIKDEMKRLHSQKDDLHRQIESATELSSLYVEIDHFLKNKLAPIRYSRSLTERRDSKVAMDNLAGIIEMVDEWSREMKAYLPRERMNTIDAEVIEYE